jgi:transcriptional regulator with XRE-family HTH domain
MDTRLAEIRERKGMKQAELARRTGISRGQIANLESGTRTMDLPTLRRCARELGVTVVELLLPEDAPNQPDDAEASLLQELRAATDYNPRAVLVAAKGVIAAANSVRAVQAVPKALGGDPKLAAEMAQRWNSVDDGERERTLALFDTARSFARR